MSRSAACRPGCQRIRQSYDLICPVCAFGVISALTEQLLAHLLPSGQLLLPHSHTMYLRTAAAVAANHIIPVRLLNLGLVAVDWRIASTNSADGNQQRLQSAPYYSGAHCANSTSNQK